MKKYLQPRAEEGNTDTVPAMLTPGEFVIRKDAVDEIGIDKLHALNNIDRLSDMSALTNYRPAQFQEGGEVSGRKKAHLALAGMGMVPGVGNVADIADAALYGLEGDKLGALMSLASAVPLAGLAVGAGKFGKAAKKLKYDPNVASSVPTPRTKTGQFFKDPFRGVSKKKLLKEVENAGLPDAYGEPVSYFKKLDASELAEILRGYYGRDLQYVKDVGFQEGGEVMNYYGGGMVRNKRTQYQEGGVVEALEAFGEKSKSADELVALIALRASQDWKKRANESKPYHGPPIPKYLKPFPKLQLRKTKPMHLEPIAPVPSTGFQQGGMVPQQCRFY
jgi:hypothetical protein